MNYAYFQKNNILNSKNAKHAGHSNIYNNNPHSNLNYNQKYYENNNYFTPYIDNLDIEE